MNYYLLGKSEARLCNDGNVVEKGLVSNCAFLRIFKILIVEIVDVLENFDYKEVWWMNRGIKGKI